MNFPFKILSKAGCNMNKNGRNMKSYMKAISVGNFALITEEGLRMFPVRRMQATYGRDVIPVGIVKHQRGDKKSE